MIKQLRHFFDSYFTPQAAVLMYHRVAEVKSDIWDITVSPENFERQLQRLQQSGNVISLAEMAENLQKKRVKKNSIAITFDDGYADNYAIAKPLLEKYNLPATFFITTSNIGRNSEFWWNELENLILFTQKLPPFYSGNINGKLITFELLEEAELKPNQKKNNENWKACDETLPNMRCAMFLKLWQILKPLPPKTQHQELQKLHEWAGTEAIARNGYQSITENQLQKLSQNPLFEIGAHTSSHAALAYHEKEFQEQELRENRSHLQDLTGREIKLLSYPYGNYNTQTLRIAHSLNFKAACTTEEVLVKKETEQYRIGRFQVKDQPPEILAKHFPASFFRM